MIQPERIQPLNSRPEPRGDYVLYWMQASQRPRWNHALEHAVACANQRRLPLVVVFGLTDQLPEANLRHFAFMLRGLRQTRDALARRGVQLVVRRASPDQAALDLARDAALLVTDRGYLRIQRQWRFRVAREAPCPVVQVESDAVVPIELASQKEEYAARTIRPRLHAHLERFLVALPSEPLKADSLHLQLDGINISDTDAALAPLRLDRSVLPVSEFLGGPDDAERLLAAFLRDGLPRYAHERSDPSKSIQSHMSPYLHFGQVSPVEIALRVMHSHAPADCREAYLEELIVRRELSLNFVHYNAHYDSYQCLPPWARQTLATAAHDPRKGAYTRRQLEEARTSDPYWNAAQLEMVRTGKMHNYMRMYWGKKIIEWSATPGEAFTIALHLNNKYELDGHDPNSFAGVAWCFGKHDRPWTRRAVFGTVRYMNAAGLERKFDMEAYVRRVGGV